MDALPADVRRARLLAQIVQRGFIRVTDAALEFGVSDVTVRTDLAHLEALGGIVRVHGGAMPRGALVDRESPVEESVAQAASAKAAIGRAAAAIVSPGDSVLLDVGSTALAVATALVERRDLSDVVIVTSGLAIALALEPGIPRFTVIVTGGTLRPLQHSLVNPNATTMLDTLRVDLAIIGCNGVDAGAGVTNINLPEAEVKRKMMAASSRRVVIADSSKLGQRELGVIGEIEEFDALVTAGDGADDQLESLRKLGLDVVRAA